MGRPLVDLTGQVFDRLTVVAYIGREHHSSLWSCRCACGSEVKVHSSSLKSGGVRSCGCYRRERMAGMNYQHGGNNTPEYNIWTGILDRCANPKSKKFAEYGGRGVGIAPEWRADFPAFLAHVGPRPTSRHSIDRIDNNRGYEPGNVRWATQSQQCRNKRNNRIVPYQGRDMTMAEACELSGFSKHVVRKRLANGWGFARAFSEPLHAEKSHAR